MSSPNNITESYLGAELNLEDTARLVSQLRSGIPKKIDSKFAKLFEENEALKHRVEVLEADHIQHRKSTDRRFERERVDVQLEISRNIAALDATLEDKEQDNDVQASTSDLPLSNADRSSVSASDDASHNRAGVKMKIESLKQEIAGAAASIFNEPVQVTARTHKHWHNSGNVLECFIAFISGVRFFQDRLKILVVGPPELTELGALQGLKDMVKENYEAANFPSSTGVSSDTSSESSRDNRVTPSNSSDDQSDSDAEPSSSLDRDSVERDDSGHPRKGSLRPI
ncbi:MAG: hypothetical protein Q9157_002790 [Trypethelium eluteriae]